MADLRRRIFGYSSASVRSALTERDASLERASEKASAAEQRAERLSSELSETQGRLAGLEEQLDTAEKLSVALTADLERAVAEREAVEAEVLPLRRELEEVHTELRNAKEAILGQEERLSAAQEGSASLEELLRQQSETLEQARAEAAQSQESLRALEESGGFQAAMSAQQGRVLELEALVEGYRELIEGGNVPAAPSAEPSDAQEPPAGPSTASELAAVIEVAEQAVASIMESTRVRADEELRAVDGERERIRRDVETMTAWRDRAAPMIVALQAAMREIQSQGAEIGLRVNEALHPVSTAVTALDAQLASLDDLAKAPLDVSPDGPAPSEPDSFMELPEHPASRDSSDESRYR